MCRNKILIFLLFVTTSLFADIFESNCVSCHAYGQLNKFYSQYTLQYSSKEKTLQAMKEFLQNPSYEKSMMPRGFLNRFGLKEKTELTDDQLTQALQIYLERYSFSNKLY